MEKRKHNAPTADVNACITLHKRPATAKGAHRRCHKGGGQASPLFAIHIVRCNPSITPMFF